MKNSLSVLVRRNSGCSRHVTAWTLTIVFGCTEAAYGSSYLKSMQKLWKTIINSTTSENMTCILCFKRKRPKTEKILTFCWGSVFRTSKKTRKRWQTISSASVLSTKSTIRSWVKSITIHRLTTWQRNPKLVVTRSEACARRHVHSTSTRKRSGLCLALARSRVPSSSKLNRITLSACFYYSN